MATEFLHIDDLKNYIGTITFPIKNLLTSAEGIQTQFDEQKHLDICTIRYLRMDSNKMAITEAHFYSDGTTASIARWVS